MSKTKEVLGSKHYGVEFIDKPVPQDRRIAWWTIALVKIGIVLALPAFLVGVQIGHSMGMRNGAIAIFAGAGILAVLAALTATVGAKSHLSTSMITQFPFGRVGARAINFVLGLTLIGWFAVTAELFGETLTQSVRDLWGLHLEKGIFTAIGGALMVTTTVFGFRVISRLADLAVPLMFSMLVVIVYIATKNRDLGDLLHYAGTGTMSLGIGISAVVGGPAVGTIVFPDIARYARSAAHGRAAAISTYALGLTSVLLLVAVTSIAMAQSDMITIMFKMGLGVFALAFVVFLAWTTNVGNLYSSALVFSVLLGKAPFQLIVLAVGVLSTSVALMGMTQHFVPFLLLLGISIPPIAGIYVTDFFLRGRSFDPDELARRPAVGVPAFVAWGAGIAIGFSSSRGVLVFTGIPACDSIVVAAGTYVTAEIVRRSFMGAARRNASLAK